MSYTLPNPQPTVTGLATLLETIAAKYVPTLTAESLAYLQGNGQVAMLTPTTPLVDGTATFPVWGSCVPQDDPGVPGLQMFAIILAGRSGAPWLKANGDPVATWHWFNIPDAVVASHPIQAIRNALLLFLLGEQQTPGIVEDKNDAIMTSISIVTKANAALRQEATVAAAL